MLEVGSIFEENVWKRNEINNDAQDHQNWSKEHCHHQLNNVLTLIGFPLVGCKNENAVGINLEDQNWCSWYKHDGGYEAIENHHDRILDLEHDVATSLASQCCQNE